LLNYRLTILDEYVDYVILVESKYTFTGLSKPLYYNENKHMFEKFNNKIIHIIIEDDIPFKNPNINNHEQWQNEYYQRNAIQKGLDMIKNNINDDDIILTSDLDEIPNPNILLELKHKTYNFYIAPLTDPTIEYNEKYIFNPEDSPLKYNDNDVHQLELDMYYCNLRSRRNYWHGVKIFTYGTHKRLNYTFQNYRSSFDFPIIKNGGWHLSYFCDLDNIINKFKSFSDAEYNNDIFMNKNTLQHNIDNYANILNFSKLACIPIDKNNNLPPKYDIYLKKYL
jgi:beta-1,4-mannosyl-glycoprotein beta-1,4-N-acetylglucosaminyltransferase